MHCPCCIQYRALSWERNRLLTMLLLLLLLLLPGIVLLGIPIPNRFATGLLNFFRLYPIARLPPASLSRPRLPSSKPASNAAV